MLWLLARSPARSIVASGGPPAARAALILALSHAAVAAAHHLLPTELLTVPVSRGNHPIERAFLSIFRGEAAVCVQNAYRALPLRH